MATLTANNSSGAAATVAKTTKTTTTTTAAAAAATTTTLLCVEKSSASDGSDWYRNGVRWLRDHYAPSEIIRWGTTATTVVDLDEEPVAAASGADGDDTADEDDYPGWEPRDRADPACLPPKLQPYTAPYHLVIVTTGVIRDCDILSGRLIVRNRSSYCRGPIRPVRSITIHYLGGPESGMNFALNGMFAEWCRTVTFTVNRPNGTPQPSQQSALGEAPVEAHELLSERFMLSVRDRIDHIVTYKPNPVSALTALDRQLAALFDRPMAEARKREQRDDSASASAEGADLLGEKLQSLYERRAGKEFFTAVVRDTVCASTVLADRRWHVRELITDRIRQLAENSLESDTTPPPSPRPVPSLVPLVRPVPMDRVSWLPRNRAPLTKRTGLDSLWVKRCRKPLIVDRALLENPLLLLLDRDLVERIGQHFARSIGSLDAHRVLREIDDFPEDGSGADGGDDDYYDDDDDDEYAGYGSTRQLFIISDMADPEIFLHNGRTLSAFFRTDGLIPGSLALWILVVGFLVCRRLDGNNRRTVVRGLLEYCAARTVPLSLMAMTPVAHISVPLRVSLWFNVVVVPRMEAFGPLNLLYSPYGISLIELYESLYYEEPALSKRRRFMSLVESYPGVVAADDDDDARSWTRTPALVKLRRTVNHWAAWCYVWLNRHTTTALGDIARAQSERYLRLVSDPPSGSDRLVFLDRRLTATALADPTQWPPGFVERFGKTPFPYPGPLNGVRPEMARLMVRLPLEGMFVDFAWLQDLIDSERSSFLAAAENVAVLAAATAERATYDYMDHVSINSATCRPNAMCGDGLFWRHCLETFEELRAESAFDLFVEFCWMKKEYPRDYMDLVHYYQTQSRRPVGRREIIMMYRVYGIYTPTMQRLSVAKFNSYSWFRQ